MRSCLAPVIAALCLIAAAAPTAAVSAPPADRTAWAAQASPAPGPARVVGTYSLGCIGGAVALAPQGDGWQVLRLQRNRYYGHPHLIRFVERFAGQVEAGGLGIALVGDLAQPRGGPMSHGHASHQTGLDVDVWFRLATRPLPPAERDAPKGISMVAPGGVLSEAWTPAQGEMLRLAASDPAVDRIFVNAAIKHAVCRAHPGDKPAWVTRLRPWWGHDEHFHVRLSCPADSPDCEPSPAIPPGDGCDEAVSWLEAQAKPAPPRKTAAAKPPPPPLPERCDSVLLQ